MLTMPQCWVNKLQVSDKGYPDHTSIVPGSSSKEVPCLTSFCEQLLQISSDNKYWAVWIYTRRALTWLTCPVLAASCEALARCQVDVHACKAAHTAALRLMHALTTCAVFCNPVCTLCDSGRDLQLQVCCRQVCCRQVCCSCSGTDAD